MKFSNDANALSCYCLILALIPNSISFEIFDLRRYLISYFSILVITTRLDNALKVRISKEIICIGKPISMVQLLVREKRY